jgi:hypothetical protein
MLACSSVEEALKMGQATTIDVIVHADGTIEPLTPIAAGPTRRAILTILDPTVAPVTNDNAIIDRILLADGLQEVPDEISADLVRLSEEALDALWSRIPVGTPLSRIVIEDREESF